ncbi:MAG: nicotinate-nucleotide--dimethylbenzimidazole phosphoribosyltransferase [Clostridiales bacterium]|nr:nicotinate-nucleotide--dimethylbenzimidazole phosphoribosyltransferase [Clostridiales bacterium]
MELELALKNIKNTDENAKSASEKRWLSVVKPLFSLGRLENAVSQIAAIKGKPFFSLDKKTLILMCADNGVVAEGISQCGQEVTAIVAKSFMEMTSAACVMAKRAGVEVLPIDCGMATDIDGLRRIKTAYGTANIAKGPAMMREDCVTIIEKSIDIVGGLKNSGSEIILTGEMGIGNTTTSAAVTAVLLNQKAENITGRGAGLDSESLKNKIRVVEQAININSPNPNDPIDVISKVGGFDIAAMTGLFIGGAVHKVPVVIDGIISSVSALAAVRLNEKVSQYILPSHLSNEPAGKLLLESLGLEPFITCGMFLGEGSGAVALMPLLDMALDVYTKVGTFDNWEHEAYKVLR